MAFTYGSTADEIRSSNVELVATIAAAVPRSNFDVLANNGPGEDTAESQREDSGRVQTAEVGVVSPDRFDHSNEDGIRFPHCLAGWTTAVDAHARGCDVRSDERNCGRDRGD